MDIEKALAAVEYKLATDSDCFESGRIIRMDIHSGWPPATELADALARRQPFVSLYYEHQANEKVQLVLQKIR